MESHEIKINTYEFAQILSRYQTFLVLEDGENPYNHGDFLHIKEWDYYKLRYTGRWVNASIQYVYSSSKIQNGYVVVGILVCYEPGQVRQSRHV